MPLFQAGEKCSTLLWHTITKGVDMPTKVAEGLLTSSSQQNLDKAEALRRDVVKLEEIAKELKALGTGFASEP